MEGSKQVQGQVAVDPMHKVNPDLVESSAKMVHLSLCFDPSLCLNYLLVGLSVCLEAIGRTNVKIHEMFTMH